MIDRTARSRMAESLRHLASGAISTGEFAKATDELVCHTPDEGVRSVLAATEIFHGDNYPLWSFRLRGRNRPARDLRRQLAIAVVFLHSDAEYAWPEDCHCPASSWDLFLLMACAFCVCGVMVLSTLLWISAVRGMLLLFAALAFADAASLYAAVFLFRHSQNQFRKHYARWIESLRPIGDYDVWPFLCRKEFDKARKSPRLLAGR